MCSFPLSICVCSLRSMWCAICVLHTFPRITCICIFTKSVYHSVRVFLTLAQNHASVLVNGTCQIPDPVYKLVGSIVCFYIPLGVMLITYCLTVRTLAKQRQNLGGNQQSNGAGTGGGGGAAGSAAGSAGGGGGSGGVGSTWGSSWLGQAPSLGELIIQYFARGEDPFAGRALLPCRMMVYIQYTIVYST